MSRSDRGARARRAPAKRVGDCDIARKSPHLRKTSIPPSRLRRATSLYTREALERNFQKIWPRRGQTVGRRKSVKKNAALLHFLAFPSNDHPFGVLRGEQPLSRASRAIGSSGHLFRFLFGCPKRKDSRKNPTIKGDTARWCHRQAPSALFRNFLLALSKNRNQPPRHWCPHCCAILGNAAQLGKNVPHQHHRQHHAINLQAKHR